MPSRAGAHALAVSATSLRSVTSRSIGPQPESSGLHIIIWRSNLHRTSRSPSVISPGPSAARALTRITRSPSVISLTDSEPANAGPSAARVLTMVARSPSVISLDDSEPDNAGPSMPRVLMDAPVPPHSNSDLRAGQLELTQPHKVDRTPSLPPQPIIEWGSTACVRSHGQSHENAINVEDVRLWPMDFHVCDVAQFIRLTRLPSHHQRLRRMFEEYFGIPFCPQTFRKTREVWECRANRNLHEHFIDYRRSERGLWSTFMTEAKQVI